MNRFKLVEVNEFDSFVMDTLEDKPIPMLSDLVSILNKLYEENEFLNSLLEEYEDSMFSEKDFSNYLQACHGGNVKNIRGGQ